MKKLLVSLAATLLGGASVSAADVSSVVAYPIFRETYSCTEHWQGNLKGLGDELGADCWVQRRVEINGRTWSRAYAAGGFKNEEWYGWGQDVLSPCTCVVVKINVNPVVNRPGIVGKPPATFIVLKREDGVFFLLAHVAKIRVQVGDVLQSGQTIAQVGNNGYSRHPHIHVGAWKGEAPLQIRFDLVSMGKLFEN
jgi:hypothetical protein